MVILTSEEPNELDADFGYNCTEACGACDGKVTELTLEYQGDVGVHIRVEQKKDKKIVFDGFVSPGEIFSFVGQGKKGTLTTEIRIYVNGALRVKVHTSCSKAIGPGLVFGEFLVVSGASRNGGPLCPVSGMT